MDPNNELAALSAAVRRRVEREARRGRATLHVGSREELQVPTSAPRSKAAPPAAAKPERSGTPRAAAGSEPPAPAADSADRGNRLSILSVPAITPVAAERAGELATLAETASTCTQCGLCETRTKVVFSRGSARYGVMFIGEAPGADEDRLGEPFVGRAGKLLDQILDATGFEREHVYVANILKCRPPGNRDPRPEEIETCTPYLEQQIDLVRPRILCALGKFAAQFLTGQPKATMGSLRGKRYEYRGIPVIPTYHPAALLRNPQWKRTVWEDMQVLRREYLASSGE